MPNLIKQLSDPWIVFGFLAQFVFFLRFFIQWLASEKEKKSIIPLSFWYISVVGSVMLLIYSIQRGDLVFITATVLNTIIYLRNILLINRNKKPQL